MRFQGIYVAAATPFDHTGAIYRTKVQHNFEKWSRTSVAGFLVGSLAGEGPLLSDEEKVEVAAGAVKAVPEGKTVLLDVSHEGVRCAAELARKAAGAGVHAVVSLVPHEYRGLMYGPEVQSLYFRALADQSPVPYPLFLMAALVPWQYFATSLTDCDRRNLGLCNNCRNELNKLNR